MRFRFLKHLIIKKWRLRHRWDQKCIFFGFSGSRGDATLDWRLEDHSHICVLFVPRRRANSTAQRWEKSRNRPHGYTAYRATSRHITCKVPHLDIMNDSTYYKCVKRSDALSRSSDHRRRSPVGARHVVRSTSREGLALTT